MGKVGGGLAGAKQSGRLLCNNVKLPQSIYSLVIDIIIIDIIM